MYSLRERTANSRRDTDDILHNIKRWPQVFFWGATSKIVLNAAALLHPLTAMTFNPSASSPLCTIPPEVLEHVAYQLACLTPLGPPSDLVPLLLTCKKVRSRLSGNTLYSRIFSFKFDDGAVKRRAFLPTPGQYFDQLKLYCTLLQRLSAPFPADDCDDLLFGVYLMMLENDGRNAAQLIHAGLTSYLDNFLRTRMWSDASHGWPTSRTSVSCALWLVWMMSTRETLMDESPARREEIIQLVLPFVLVPFRYASAFAPINHWRFPLHRNDTARVDSILTAHGPYPIYLNAGPWVAMHYNTRPPISQPLATSAAKLIYFSRRETMSFGVPPHLPLTRADAEAAGISRGPTQEDIREVNAHLNEKLPELAAASDEPLSKRWDNDWWRLRRCFDAWRPANRRLPSIYEPGTFTGLWQGRMLVPSENHFNALITTQDYPQEFDEDYLGTTIVPVFMRIAEHHSYAPNDPVPCCSSGENDDGVSTAYFPPDARISTDARSATVRAGDVDYEYATYGAPGAASHDPDTCLGCRQREESLRATRARQAAVAHDELFARAGLGLSPDSDSDDAEWDDDPPPHDPDRLPACNGIQDIIFTGGTDMRHGQAWNNFEFHGRLRPWDGLICLLRVPADPRHGTLFFYGYIVGGHKFVGNWRMASHDPGMPAYESAFSMARRE
ncbi:hypothetical protein FB45DRAFT_913313 [Roridomyces roridus]|uniref:F-box domain-containing protein n=1 Tax=Roridomyces roridus TaxID=1738132 RepID=A0AAD7BWM7_9AGAR|nr:hypothetical protein FB45DRAFT_913313 [Roridomyces roridus]